MKGKALKVILKAIINLQGLGVNFHGVDYKVFRIPSFIPYIGNKQWAFALRVKGKKIDNNANYTVSLPSEIGYALKITLPEAAKKLLPDLKNTEYYYWDVMESYIRANSPIQCLDKKAPVLTIPDQD